MGYFDIKELVQTLKATKKRVNIIRIPEEISSYAASIVGGKLSLNTDLDYAYPVHIIDTSVLSEMKGTKFMKFRNKIKAAIKEGTEVRQTNFTKQDTLNMRKVLSEWAPVLFGKNHESDTDYIKYVFNKLLFYPNIRGLISERSGTPNGFTIWEEPQEGYDTANSLIHCSLRQRGVSELLHLRMAEILRNKGIAYLSLGGAESKGLDDFKKKMHPIRSVVLNTISA